MLTQVMGMPGVQSRAITVILYREEEGGGERKGGGVNTMKAALLSKCGWWLVAGA
jgi:hypothetical protein